MKTSALEKHMVRKGHSIADIKKGQKKSVSDEDKIDDVSAGKGAPSKLAGVKESEEKDKKKVKKPPYL